MNDKQNSDRARLDELTKQVTEALAVLSSEEADQIIGEATKEYGVLIRGVKAMLGMHWSAMRNCGLRQTKQSLKYAGQTLLTIATLIHYAYALGMRRGREGAPS